jgi:ring-1,2-phenylacetyl-CoA epoxidase subunit PaaC
MLAKPSDVPQSLRPVLTSHLLAMADDKFLLGHRNGDWTGLGPFLEADIAFSNVAQDEIAHAQELYKLAAGLMGRAADATVAANELAYGRPADARLCCRFVEPEDDFDWAVAVCRQCFFDHFDLLRLEALRGSAFKPLADLAGKMVQEIGFHIEHFDDWVGRLGRGTPDSAERVQKATNRLWPALPSLFAPVEGQRELVQSGIVPVTEAALAPAWQDRVSALLGGAGVRVPARLTPASEPRRCGGSRPELAAALAEISEVYNIEPGAQW